MPRPFNIAASRKQLKTCVNAERVLHEPLPGVTDHTEFTRVTADLGRCTVCDEGKAVFRSAEGRVKLCEKCYGRLVRAWNGRKGIA